MSTVIGDLFVRLGVDMKGLNTDLSSAENRLEKFGTSMFFLGSRITAGVSIPATTAVGAIAKFGIGFDKAMTESMAIMSQADRQLRPQMEAVALALAGPGGVKFSAEEAAEGYYHLASAGLDAATSMGALPIAARFAQAGVMDLEKATEFLATAQAAMSTGSETSAEKVEQMARVADVLTLANNRAIGTIQDFAEALTNKAGAALRQSHKDIEEGVAVLAAYAEQGIKGKAAGQQLWMVIRDLGTFALKNADAFRKHGIAVYDATGKMKNMADIIASVEKATMGLSDAQRQQMFTELGIPLRSVAATKSLIGYSEAIREHEKALRSAGGTTKEVSDNQMQAMANQLIVLAHGFQNTAIEIYQAFVPTIKNYIIPAIQEGLTLFKEFGTFLATMPEPMKLVALGLTAIAIAAGPLIAFLGSMSLLTSAAIGGIGAITGLFGQMAGAAGLAAGGVSALAVSETALNAATAAAYAETVAAANGMGIFGAAAIDAGMAAKAVTAETILAGTAAEATAGSVGLFGTAMAVLMNPITLVVGGLAALVGGYYLYQKAHDAHLTAIAGDAENYKKGTAALEDQLIAFLNFHNNVKGGIGNLAHYAVAVDGLAKASGLSRDAFLKEANSSQNLTNELWAQLNARKALWEEIVNRGKTSVLAAEKQVEDLEAQYKKVWSGQGTKTSRGAGPADLTEVPLNMDERVSELHRLEVALEAAKKAAIDAKTAYNGLVGGGKDKSLAYEGPQLNKQQIQALYEQQLSAVRAAGGNTAELQAAWRTLLFPTGKEGGGGMPPDTEKTLKGVALAAKNMADEWRGGGKDLDAFTTAWGQMSAAAKADPVVRQRMWESYDKLRQSLGAGIPAFEKFFAAEVEQADAAAKAEHMTKDWSDTLSDSASEIVADSNNMLGSVMKLNSTNAWTFWEKNGKALEELIPLYASMPPAVQAIIAAFQRFKLAQGPGEALRKSALDGMQALDEMAAKSHAKMEDISTELDRFGQTAGQAHNSVLRSKIAEIVAEQEKKYKQMAETAALYTGKEYDDYQKTLTQMKADDATYLTNFKAVEQGKYAAAIGVNQKLLRAWKSFNEKQQQDIIATQEKWNQLQKVLNASTAALQGLGELTGMLGEGFADFSAAVLGAADAGATFNKGMQDYHAAENVAQQLGAIITMAQGVVKAYKAMAEQGDRSMRIMSGAMSGAQIGAQFGGGYGALVGMGIGALIGAFSADPGWKKLQDTVKDKWVTNVSKELAKTIDAESEVLGGHVNAMLVHMSDIVNENGGFTSGNVTRWARSLADVFPLVASGQMTAATAAKALDNSFANLLTVGTQTNGMVNDQIVNLVKLERQYHTGSAAVKEFVDAQVSNLTEGLGKMTSSFGTSIEKAFTTGFSGSGAGKDVIKGLFDALGDPAAMSKAQQAFNDALKEGNKELEKSLLDQFGVDMTVAGGASKYTTEELAKFRDQLGDANLDLREAQNDVSLLTAKLADMRKKGKSSAAEIENVALQLERAQFKAGQARDRISELNSKLSEVTGDTVIKVLPDDIARQLKETGATLEQVLAVVRVKYQGEFDRLSRTALASFNAIIANGGSVVGAINQIGGSIDTLIEAVMKIGFQSNAAFESLASWRVLIKNNQELFDGLDGLQQVLIALNNLGLIDQATFADLGAQATDYYNRLIGAGATADQALMAMQPTLQTLWEMETKFGYKVDEATQGLIDQAVAAGAVGAAHMSANDRMIAGIDKLVGRFDLFLKHLGIDLPEAAQKGADGVQDALDGITVPDIIIHPKWGDPGPFDNSGGDNSGPEKPEPPPMAAGGVLTRPTQVLAGEAGPEAIIPLDRLFAELDARNHSGEGQTLELTIEMDGMVMAKKTVKNIPEVLRLRGV